MVERQSMKDKIEFDAVVVGAGLAGCAAAIVMARAGMNVAIVERGKKPGAKNYFGGAIYTHAIAEVLPDFMDRKPKFERPVTEAGFWFLSEDGGMTRMMTRGGQLAHDPADAYTALRADFDLWWAEQAQAEGAFLIPKTTVVDFIRRSDGQVIGVLTDRPQGEIYAPVVIVGEGVNNLLVQKLDLIKHDIEPARAALAFKQVISLDQEVINTRFGLSDKNSGIAVSVLGDVTMGLPGLGFIYTNRKSVSVGLGMMLDAVAEYRLRPYEVLQRYLEHPAIAPLLAGGQLLEYGAHLIPEGGYRDVPNLYHAGVMVAGDAAAMVNALHWEGTNMAIVSGRFAGETAVEAHRRGNFSERALSAYRDRLQDGFILQDLKQYRNFSRFLETHPEFMSTYPAFINEALGRFFSAYGKPKRRLFGEIFRSLTERRSLLKATGDIVSMGRAVMGW